MIECQGVVRHADSTGGHQQGSLWVSTTFFRESLVKVMVPATGTRTDVVTCAVCGKSLDVKLSSSRRKSFVYVLKAIVWMAVFVGTGWISFRMIASNQLTDALLWIPMVLLWGIGPFIAGLIATTVILGEGPVGELVGGGFREGEKHEFFLRQSASVYGSWAILIITQLLGLAMGYQFYVSHWGSQPDGDRLVQLIGLDHQGDEAAKILRSLGDLDRDQGENTIYWKRHRVSIAWNDSGKIDSVSFGQFYSRFERFEGPLPFGLTLSDTLATVETKLGPPERGDDTSWMGHSKSGHGVQVRMMRSSTNDGISMSDVVVHDPSWNPPPE